MQEPLADTRLADAGGGAGTIPGGGWASGIYRGSVSHRRTWPRRHHLHYRVWSLLVDLDELGALDRQLRLFSHNRFNLLSFHDADHGDGSDTPLAAQITRMLADAGAGYDGGAIRLWCMPRVLGHVFNPISVYFCHRSDGSLCALVHEVNNTFGQRHSYVIPVTGPVPADRVVRQQCDKHMHVSPFLDMDMRYDFRVSLPAEKLTVAIQARAPDQATPILSACFAGRRRALTDIGVLAAWTAQPLLTWKVVAAIHWEALRLLLKGVGFRRSPPPPLTPVSVVSPHKPSL
ncbi:DUF1365 domain-containing protein [Nitrospirillum iridis]|uniref:DUF1365 domain-containing protein n=1 Tax=Nitrospirillum iridis TaxID=765888 RepID=A0A7X0AXC7_9PROT|nr:DUF1365 family protein [Nitrospirillum iridis]MBB6251857.1 hypothetical protein [Nitrospirillum iridis]